MSTPARRRASGRLLWPASCLALGALVSLVSPAAGRTIVSKSAPTPIYSVFYQPGRGDSQVISLIRHARYSIRLEIYELTDRHILAALERAHRRDIKVRVLLEEHPYDGSRYAQAAFHELQSAGVAVRWANESMFTYTHEKALDVDHRVAGIFTFNLTYSGLFGNREFGVIDRRRKDAGQIGSIFKADWNRSRYRRLSDKRLVVSPINARPALSRLIDSSHHTLDLYEEEMYDSRLESHLVRAARRHVRVRLLTSEDSGAVGRLRQGGVRVRILTSPYVHAKAILSDRRRLFVGSENISSTSLDQNREVGIILRHRTGARVFSKVFSSDWSAVGGGANQGGHHGKLILSLSANPHSVVRGQLLTISASTASGASCAIKVTYPDGYVSHARALSGFRTADAKGLVEWSWHVGSAATGTAHAAVSCLLRKALATKTISFAIKSK